MESKNRKTRRTTKPTERHCLYNESIEKGRFVLVQIDWISRLESGEEVAKRTPVQKELFF